MRAVRLQVKDPTKESYGAYFYKCPKDRCKMFKWEELPESKSHWPWIIGTNLIRRGGEFKMEPSSCDHPLEKLKGMGGIKAAMTCDLCGGRWEKGPAADMLIGESKKKTLSRLISEDYETVFGKFCRPAEDRAPRGSPVEPAVMRPKPKLHARTAAGSSRLSSQGRTEEDMRKTMQEVKRELAHLKKENEKNRRSRKTKPRMGSDHDAEMEDAEWERLSWSSSSSK